MLFSLSSVFFYPISFSFSVKKPFVITSFSILESLTSEITNNFVETFSIVGSNADAHAFSPTPNVNKIISKADLVIINGLGFEGWISRLFNADGYNGTIVVSTSNISPLYNKTFFVDPHAWGNPKNLNFYVSEITLGINYVIPHRQEIFLISSMSLYRRLDRLIQEVMIDLIYVPRKNRKIITAHDAFEYFGAGFNISFLSPLGLSTNASPSAKEIARLVRYIHNEDIEIIFIENMANEKLIRHLAEETDVMVNGPLYSDALSPIDGSASNYFSMIYYNWRLMLKSIDIIK
jgi:zinc/manganese transport system substrate-binding protein